MKGSLYCLIAQRRVGVGSLFPAALSMLPIWDDMGIAYLVCTQRPDVTGDQTQNLDALTFLLANRCAAYYERFLLRCKQVG